MNSSSNKKINWTALLSFFAVIVVLIYFAFKIKLIQL